MKNFINDHPFIVLAVAFVIGESTVRITKICSTNKKAPAKKAPAKKKAKTTEKKEG